mmetsp:Transcript_49494/g.56801  ORF Transcript_49494/g.56801 Transcript_49494/m.56801 type:complete len:99 (+) Transcript_49494:255-551(+)
MWYFFLMLCYKRELEQAEIRSSNSSLSSHFLASSEKKRRKTRETGMSVSSYTPFRSGSKVLINGTSIVIQSPTVVAEKLGFSLFLVFVQSDLNGALFC